MTESALPLGTVQIKTGCSNYLKENLDRIGVLFAAQLEEIKNDENLGEDHRQDNVKLFNVFSLAPNGCERAPSTDFIIRLQKYVDDICGEGCHRTQTGEDSSYDSDYEADSTTSLSNIATTAGQVAAPADKHHHDVSRTTSDTLAAEYAEYVQTQPDDHRILSSATYVAQVEFALKLGYTEKLVQAALQKLGPTPGNNELLAELIKLGAHKAPTGGVAISGGNLSNSCDTQSAESALLDGNDVAIVSGIGSNAGGALGDANLRPIVIDGSNVAMSHGNKEIFSCRGIKICVDWFKARGHKEITVFVPKWRKEAARPDNPIRDQEILAELEKERLLVFTPSRLVGGKRMVCYDDRYILKLAAEIDGIVVSNDNYRDLCQESSEFKRVVEEKILMYSFVNDRFMPPDDPLGRSGPTLDNFLRMQSKKSDPPPPPCPYGKKCTYGNKCKYHHPERGPFPHKSVTERLSEHAQRHLQARSSNEGSGGDVRKQPLGRTRSNVVQTATAVAGAMQKDNQHTIVSKSRSVDNVGGSSGMSYQAENLHRKLQRQLTLNPIADPRLVRRYMPQQQQQQYLPPQAGSWEMHQHVTRIASAPDSYRQWPQQVTAQQQQQVAAQVVGHHRHMQRMSSCSDSQLNVWTTPTQIWQQHQQQQQEDARNKLHFHLSAIFPEEQVTQVMQMYPDETNAQKICAAILSMFPKN